MHWISLKFLDDTQYDTQYYDSHCSMCLLCDQCDKDDIDVALEV